jgi:cation diffusion facilitator CzcD-associated flavoprotein CzcO
MHAAQWDDSYSAAGRRVAVVGTGSTGVQLIPELAKEVSDLTVYQRTAIWVLPKMDFGFAPAVQRTFAKRPRTQHVIRRTTDNFTDFVVLIAMWKYRYFKPINKFAGVVAGVHRFVSLRDKKLRRALTPPYSYGCKRPTLSNSYYRTFNKPNVHLETAGIDHIESDGVVSRDGSKRVVDTLVLATGFDVWDTNLPAFEVIGRKGRNLGKWWRENKFQAYEGLSVPGFPNFLSLSSPYAWVGMSWFDTVECQMRHMNRLFGELQRRGGSTFEVTEEANARFLDRMTGLLQDSVFVLGNCASSNSYWFSGSGEAPLFRPTSIRSAVKEQDRYPLTDYAIA